MGTLTLLTPSKLDGNTRLHPQQPFIFLAGPMQGAPNWQRAAYQILGSMGFVGTIASPRGDTIDDSLGVLDKRITQKEQVAWERHYLKEARRAGLVLFWFPNPATTVLGRSYAQCSRFELGEQVGLRHSDQNRNNFVLGVEVGFPGGSYFFNVVATDCHDIFHAETLEETCILAMKALQPLVITKK